MEKSSGDTSTALGCIGFAALALLAGAAFILPHTAADQNDLAKTDKDRSDVSIAFATRFETAEVRVDQLGGFNLYVWIGRREFESLNYPDRKAFIENVGSQWCGKVDGWGSPTITVRDATNGKDLAVYHCTFRYADMNPGGS